MNDVTLRLRSRALEWRIVEGEVIAIDGDTSQYLGVNGSGALLCSEELADGSLVCAGEGPTAYEMARSEVVTPLTFSKSLSVNMPTFSITPPLRVRLGGRWPDGPPGRPGATD